MILVDTNVLIDIASRDPVWFNWSREQLNAAATVDELAINDVVYAELSIRYESVAELETMLSEIAVTVALIPRPALFSAGKAFQRYRAAGGARTGVLPDFFLGAHAAVIGAPLLTRDPRRYRTYFPGLALIAPNYN